MGEASNKRPLTAILILASAVALIAAALFVFALTVIVPQSGNRFDFFPRWAGSRAVLAGQSPYSQAVTERIQMGMFGHILPESADQQGFAHPAYSAYVLLPVVLLDASVATALWMTVQIMAVGLSVALWILMFRWKPHPLVFGLVIFGCLFVFRYPTNLFLLGQFTGSILAGFTVAVWFALNKQDIAAGVVLVLCTVPPTMGAGLAVVLACVLLLAGRWKVLAGFAASMAVLIGLSILSVGFWIPDWLEALRQYSEYSYPVWPPTLVGSPLVGLALIGVGVSFSVFDTIRFVRNATADHLRDLAVTLLLCAFLLLPSTGNYYLVLILPALVALFASGRWPMKGLGVLILVMPWVVLFATGGTRSNLEMLIIPLLALAGWIWIRLSLGLRSADAQEPMSALPQD